MLFNSIDFILFFPIVLAGFYIIPDKIRYIWLLACSYYFYMSWNPRYALLMLLSTIITYVCAIVLGWIEDNNQLNIHTKLTSKKLTLVVSLVINLAILGYFKYYNFFGNTLNHIFNKLSMNVSIGQIDVLLPVGISFYTFQAIGYTIDVYRGEIKPEKNIFKYALFVSFFPQLVAGPIERSKNLLLQFNKKHILKYENVKEGVLWVLWGYFMKLVIADRIALFVDAVYGNVSIYSGGFIVVATVCFAFQIYCDFNGYTLIARGCAKIMDFELMENFNAPYLSKNVGEFWRRWHISLSSWFKDYLYIPLGGNRKGRIRKHVNLMIVFLISGLWHGAAWGYVIWGGLNGAYQVVGDMVVDPVGRRLKKILKVKCKISKITDIIRVIITFVLIDTSWIFFRARSIAEAKQVIRCAFIRPSISIGELLIQIGASTNEMIFLVLMICVLVVMDLIKAKTGDLSKVILANSTVIKYVIYILLFWGVVMFGIYGVGYDTSSFLYFQF